MTENVTAKLAFLHSHMGVENVIQIALRSAGLVVFIIVEVMFRGTSSSGFGTGLRGGADVFAIQNIKTGKFLYGTNFGYGHNSQRTSLEKMLTFGDYYFAECAFLHRQCSRDYRIVELEPVKVKAVFPYVTKKERNGR